MNNTSIVSMTDLAESVSVSEPSAELSSDLDSLDLLSSVSSGDAYEIVESSQINVEGGDSLFDLSDIQALGTYKALDIQGEIVELSDPTTIYDLDYFVDYWLFGLVGGFLLSLFVYLIGKVIGFFASLLKG